MAIAADSGAPILVHPSGGPGDPADYIQSLYPLSVYYQSITGFAADDLIAITISESNYGNAPGNELFGIKGPGEVLPNTSNSPYEGESSSSYRSYPTVNAAIDDFFAFLNTNPRYANALQNFSRSGNSDQLVRDINAAGYAEDPDWASKIISIRTTIVDPAIAQAGEAVPAQPTSSGHGTFTGFHGGSNTQASTLGLNPGEIISGAGSSIFDSLFGKYLDKLKAAGIFIIGAVIVMGGLLIIAFGGNKPSVPKATIIQEAGKSYRASKKVSTAEETAEVAAV